MNNAIIKNVNTTVDKEIVPFVEKNGVYGVILVSMILMYDLAVKALDKGYEIDWNTGKENPGIKITRPKNDNVV